MFAYMFVCVVLCDLIANPSTKNIRQKKDLPSKILVMIVQRQEEAIITERGSRRADC